jgi:uncharacterized protein (TIGR00299 family) protein
MRVAYFDCFSGISGNMILGALIDLGLSLDGLKKELSKLHIPGYEVKASSVDKKGISAVHVDVVVDDINTERTLEDIFTIIEQSDIDEEISQKCRQVFLRLGEAEAKVHGCKQNEVHFHEVGAVDSIVDIVGAMVGLKSMGVEQVLSSPLNLGKGLVRTDHGILPVPAPATAELVKNIPVYSGEVDAELTTPTGAAIITTIASYFGNIPLLNIEKVGYGAGSMDLKAPNVLRVLLGETSEFSLEYKQEYVTVIETNIDDMNPELYDHIMSKLFNIGALDVFLTPVYMKKNRPGVLLTVFTSKERVDQMLKVIFEESTTLGVRIAETHRISLPRTIETVITKYGEIRIKVAQSNAKVVNAIPEYEDCRKAAVEHNVTLSQVYTEAQKVWST